jgi:two-component system copper resistance phosphate regulon response regulator CusR
MRLMLVEDDRQIGSVLRRGLESARYQVEWVTDGARALELAREGGFDLIILDLMLPGLDGLAVCRTLRQERDSTPVLILSARDSVEDRIRGFDNGADDYLTKPFSFAELLVRVQALLRRHHVHKTRLIRIADLEIDTRTGHVERAGFPVRLSPEEYALLEILASDEGRVFSREALRQRVAFDPIEAHLDSLRHKIDAGRAVRLIQALEGGAFTIRGPELAVAA